MVGKKQEKILIHRQLFKTVLGSKDSVMKNQGREKFVQTGTPVHFC